MAELSYPEHPHPHGVEDKHENHQRIWVCDECRCIFTDQEIRTDLATLGRWGHNCKAVKFQSRCESHLEPYMPDV
jgi:hypothetical protein